MYVYVPNAISLCDDWPIFLSERSRLSSSGFFLPISLNNVAILLLEDIAPSFCRQVLPLFFRRLAVRTVFLSSSQSVLHSNVHDWSIFVMVGNFDLGLNFGVLRSLFDLYNPTATFIQSQINWHLSLHGASSASTYNFGRRDKGSDVRVDQRPFAQPDSDYADRLYHADAGRGEGRLRCG